jgi:hypothetical protein
MNDTSSSSTAVDYGSDGESDSEALNQPSFHNGKGRAVASSSRVTLGTPTSGDLNTPAPSRRRARQGQGARCSLLLACPCRHAYAWRIGYSAASRSHSRVL